MAIRSFNSENNIRHQWKSIDQISEDLQLAVICSEDQNFLNHNGFDMKAIEKAYNENKAGKRLRGGSTISQQTVKNVFFVASKKLA
jgi:Membrane carboxypeptidase (penicillin-binding protein)